MQRKGGTSSSNTNSHAKTLFLFQPKQPESTPHSSITSSNMKALSTDTEKLTNKFINKFYESSS